VKIDEVGVEPELIMKNAEIIENQEKENEMIIRTDS
jgi:hypothetical protein